LLFDQDLHFLVRNNLIIGKTNIVNHDQTAQNVPADLDLHFLVRNNLIIDKANSVDHDQTAENVPADLDLHFLPVDNSISYGVKGYIKNIAKKINKSFFSSTLIKQSQNLMQ
jgi:hypothetical protein